MFIFPSFVEVSGLKIAIWQDSRMMLFWLKNSLGIWLTKNEVKQQSLKQVIPSTSHPPNFIPKGGSVYFFCSDCKLSLISGTGKYSARQFSSISGNSESRTMIGLVFIEVSLQKKLFRSCLTIQIYLIFSLVCNMILPNQKLLDKIKQGVT